MRKIYMQVFAFMIMAVSQLLFLEVAHANTIYTITKFRITNMDPVYHQVDIYFGELAARRIHLRAGGTEFMVDTGSSINVQNPEITIKLSAGINSKVIKTKITDLGYTQENIVTGQLGNGPNLIVHLEAYKFDSSASKVPNSLDLILSGGVKASDTIALPNGSINWSTCKTVGAAYCPSRYASENKGIQNLCDTISEFYTHSALCKKIWAEFDSYNNTKPSQLPTIVYKVPSGVVDGSCRECLNNNNLNNDITPP